MEGPNIGGLSEAAHKCLVTSFDLMPLAARGDPDAQSAMAVQALRMGEAGVTTIGDAVRAAEWWARLAVYHGRQKDMMMLAGVLMLRADQARIEGLGNEAEAYSAEGLNVLNELADEGHEDAAAMLQCAADQMCPAAVQLAGLISRTAAAEER